MIEEKSNSSHISSSAAAAILCIIQVVTQLQATMVLRKRTGRLQEQSCAIPKTSLVRRQESFNDQAFDSTQLAQLTSRERGDDTMLYLGYGSNLAAETFLGKRGIRPLSQVNIVAPSVALTFDLPGIPYSEPCFANSKYRDDPNYDPSRPRPPYHKNAWKKGLVGVVYEVTKKDYAHIIATEGGGSGYHDIVVECYVLDDDPDVPVPEEPKGTPFKAHTLYAHRDPMLRPDPDYAQPSARYLKLITDGAQEHNLPTEYRHFLGNIRSYRATTTRQQLGAFVFFSTWMPVFAFIFGSAKLFLKKDGTYPKWFANMLTTVFTTCWISYDRFFNKIFGDGERTIGDDADHDASGLERMISEKTPLLVEPAARIGAPT